MRKTNEAGVELIKSFEALRLNAYQDSVGVWTIGYGSTKGVKRGQRITKEEAEDLLREDLAIAENGVEAAITEDITDNQFAACVSLAFNIGVAAFRRSSIVRYINDGDALLAADRFLLYNRAGGKVLTGLARRRKAERALFLTPDEPEATEPALVADSAPAQTVDSPSQQTVESGGAATQVVVGGAAAAPPPIPADEPPVKITAVEPIKSGARKSIGATIVAAVTWIGLNIQDFFGKAYNAIGDHPMAIVTLVCSSVVILGIYWKYQERQTKLDERRTEQAHELTLKTMELAADQQKYSVEVIKKV